MIASTEKLHIEERPTRIDVFENGRINFTADDRARLMAVSNGKCARCGRDLSKVPSTIEHIVPLSLGGSNDSKNLLLLCKECNEAKSNSLLEIHNYYNHISPNYIKEYERFFFSQINRTRPWRHLIPFSERYYQVQPVEEYQRHVLKKRHGGRCGQFNGFHPMNNYYLRMGYPGEAEEILRFIEKRVERAHDPDRLPPLTAYYSNPYSLRSAMDDGDIYVLYNKSGEINGVYIFEPREKIGCDFVQLSQFCDQTALRPRYVLTLCCESIKILENPDADQILNDLLLCMVKAYMVPVGVTNRTGDNKKDIFIPFQWNGADFFIHFPSVRSCTSYVCDLVRGAAHVYAVRLATTPDEEYERIAEILVHDTSGTSRMELAICDMPAIYRL